MKTILGELILLTLIMLVLTIDGKSQSDRCKVADPTGTPLNIRASPNGKILRTIKNDTIVYVEQTTLDSKNRSWVQISQSIGNERKILGWVFRDFISCAETNSKEEKNEPQSKVKTYIGYLQKIEFGDRGIYWTFKNKQGKERIFRENPYTPLGYFLVAHKGKLMNISYNIIKVVVPNANDNWKMTQVNEDESFLSAKVGDLTDSVWWEQKKKQAIKDANGDTTKANKKLKSYYDALVEKAGN
jgi:hypothetical protein